MTKIRPLSCPVEVPVNVQRFSLWIPELWQTLSFSWNESLKMFWSLRHWHRCLLAAVFFCFLSFYHHRHHQWSNVTPSTGLCIISLRSFVRLCLTLCANKPVDLLIVSIVPHLTLWPFLVSILVLIGLCVCPHLWMWMHLWTQHNKCEWGSTRSETQHGSVPNCKAVQIRLSPQQSTVFSLCSPTCVHFIQLISADHWGLSCDLSAAESCCALWSGKTSEVISNWMKQK